MEKLLFCLSGPLILFVFLDLIFFHTSEPITSKLRILKITRKNGEESYRIQQRDWLCLWRDCTRMVGIDTYAYIEFDKEEKAREFVKNYQLRREEENNTKITSKEVVNEKN